MAIGIPQINYPKPQYQTIIPPPPIPKPKEPSFLDQIVSALAGILPGVMKKQEEQKLRKALEGLLAPEVSTKTTPIEPPTFMTEADRYPSFMPSDVFGQAEDTLSALQPPQPPKMNLGVPSFMGGTITPRTTETTTTKTMPTPEVIQQRMMENVGKLPPSMIEELLKSLTATPSEYTLGEGQVRYRGGKPIAAGMPKKEKEEKPTEWQTRLDFSTKYAQGNLTDEEINTGLAMGWIKSSPTVKTYKTEQDAENARNSIVKQGGTGFVIPLPDGTFKLNTYKMTKEGETNLQAKTMTVDGKRVWANYDPGTGKMIPIIDDNGNYIPAPAGFEEMLLGLVGGEGLGGSIPPPRPIIPTAPRGAPQAESILKTPQQYQIGQTITKGGVTYKYIGNNQWQAQ